MSAQQQLNDLAREMRELRADVRAILAAIGTTSSEGVNDAQRAAEAIMERNARRAAGDVCEWCNDTGLALPDDAEFAVPCDHSGPPIAVEQTEAERPSAAVNLAAVRATRAMAKETPSVVGTVLTPSVS